MKLFRPAALVLLILLSSCGGSDSPATTPVDNVQVFPTLEELLNALSQSSVTCENSWQNCPTNVAKLTFWQKTDDGFGLAVCSGTLINDNYIITNSHCIPANLNDGDDCSKQILVQFPESGNIPRESINCQRVIQKFPMANDQPDLAVIEIGSSNFNRYKTSTLKNQFTEGMDVAAFTMNPSETDTMKGVIVRKDCKVSLSNLLTLEENSNSGNVLLYGPNCNVISGNSGSGLFDMSGNMIGVIHQKIESKLLSELLVNEGVNHNELTYMGVAVNISCLKSINFSLGKGCDPQGVGTKLALVDQFIEDLLAKNGLQGENQDHIRLTIENNLSVSLTYDQSVPLSDSVTKMRKKLSDLFTEAKSVFKRIIRKVSL